MNLADRVKDTSTTTGTGPFTVSGSAPSGYQMLSAIGAVGATFGYVIDGGAEWEVGTGTITAANTFSRSPSASSNAGALVNFSAGTKTVFHSVTAAQHAKYQSTNTASFATAIPLTSLGATYMPQQTVSAVLAFTVGASPVQGALVYLRLVADGTNAPTFTGFKEWGGSLGYDNRNGIVNQVQFFYDGVDYWYSISQAVGATAVDATAPTASSALVANATPTFVDITFSEPMDQGFVPPIGTVVAATHTTTALAWLSATVLRATVTPAFVYGETRSLVITPNGTNNLRDLAGNQITTTQTIATITNNIAAPATVPATMAAPTASAGLLSASIAFVAPSNGGSAITGYTVTASTGQTATGTTSPISITMPAGGTPTFTIHATNSVGNGLESPSSNAVTPSAAATAPATMAAPVATAGDTTVSVAYVAPSNGGSAITGYTATWSGGQSVSGTANPLVITGVTNGTAGTVTITATNAVGTSTASPASNSVTPAAAGGSFARLTLKDSGLVESGTGPYVYTPSGSDFTTQRGVLNSALQSGVDGACTMTVTGTVGNALLGLQTTSALTAYTSQLLYVYGATYTGGGAASTVTASVSAQTGDLVRLRRFGSIVVAEIARTATPTAFVEALRWTGISTGVLYFGPASSGSTISGLTATGLA